MPRWHHLAELFGWQELLCNRESGVAAVVPLRFSGYWIRARCQSVEAELETRLVSSAPMFQQCCSFKWDTEA